MKLDRKSSNIGFWGPGENNELAKYSKMCALYLMDT